MNKDRVVNRLDEKGGKKNPQQKQPHQRITLKGKPSGNAKDKTKDDTQSKDVETSNNVENNDTSVADIFVEKMPEITPKQAEKLATKAKDIKNKKPSLNFETIVNGMINKVKTVFNKPTDDGKGSESGEENPDKVDASTGDGKGSESGEENPDKVDASTNTGEENSGKGDTPTDNGEENSGKGDTPTDNGKDPESDEYKPHNIINSNNIKIDDIDNDDISNNQSRGNVTANADSEEILKEYAEMEDEIGRAHV